MLTCGTPSDVKRAHSTRACPFHCNRLLPRVIGLAHKAFPSCKKGVRRGAYAWELPFSNSLFTEGSRGRSFQVWPNDGSSLSPMEGSVIHFD